MAAAIDLDFLKKVAPEARFVRAMPNIGILVQESFTAYCADSQVNGEGKAEVEKLLSTLGRVVKVDEKHMNGITALSGCAPAYLSVILDAMVYAGLEGGLSEELALESSTQSMVGTGRLILELVKTPSEIKDMVTTPRGAQRMDSRN